MKHRVEERVSFDTLGQEIELTTNQKNNMNISTQFWYAFNQNLKKAKFSQNGNWLKYAFMERRNGRLFYHCAIPDNGIRNPEFILKHIEASTYVVVEHIGSMDKIYQTYDEIYHKIIPDYNFTCIKQPFLHFEKYDERFHWNRMDSIIEIWIPIEKPKK